eukprot:CAMPEP_0175907878 /NCGR_PEP_ID=MMETSP0108-20121206/6296_1 /TAXON_ID=195067 ORGANISM="Goniomonas pacifica, Strain CCMP1869" /NCGR_SAMPLE_ID=MMETSP0108 /ASSEMBLY_ACC=CAM_ASM_000204 /LENGTH=85 /DNA_ID=CAMNT_0017229889 /DNA_START=20 /DNA_END=278 /DNA_ORIENTATION=+
MSHVVRWKGYVQQSSCPRLPGGLHMFEVPSVRQLQRGPSLGVFGVDVGASGDQLLYYSRSLTIYRHMQRRRFLMALGVNMCLSTE